LEVGTTWWQGGMGIKLTQPDLSEPDGFGAHFTIYNQRTGQSPALFTYGIESFSAMDDVGNRFTVSPGCTCGPPWPVSLQIGRQTDVLGNFGMQFSGSLTNRNIHYVLVTVTGFSSIDKAQWRIDVGSH
jgi:hypothetical protein